MGSSAKIKFVLAGLLFMGIASNIRGQKVEKQEVDSLWWKQKTEQLDYSEEKPEFRNTEMMDFPEWIGSPVFMYGIMFFVTLVLLFVLYKLFGKGLFVNDMEGDKTAVHLLTEDDLDDRFYEMDLEGLLKKAIAGQNWAMAIRIRFLIILKMLIDKKQVIWHKDLTNRQIAWQIKGIESREKFYELVGYFEKVWYGDTQVNEAYFQKVTPLFDEYKVSEKSE